MALNSWKCHSLRDTRYKEKYIFLNLSFFKLVLFVIVVSTIFSGFVCFAVFAKQTNVFCFYCPNKFGKKQFNFM